MAEPQFADHHDDLPRTFRREREAREREAREREAREREAEAHDAAMAAAHPSHGHHGPHGHPPHHGYQQPSPAYQAHEAASEFGAPEPAPAFGADAMPVFGGAMAPGTVTRFEVPFLHMMVFFLKAVIAAIPALILLTALLWAGGQGLKAFFPGFRHFEIVIKSSQPAGEAVVAPIKPVEPAKAAPAKK